METENVNPSLISVSNKYGVIESKLKPGFTEKAGAIERKYKIENIPSEVMDICHELAGVGGRALMVGGSVRDEVISQERQGMKLRPKDFDLEVYGLSPEELQRVLIEKFGEERVDAVGRAFGVLKVKIEGWDEPLDFSIPRRDSKTGEGHRGFDIEGVPDMMIKEAAGRRDITINSMAYDPLTETIYDPFDGIGDVKEGLLRMTSEKAFREDPLRVIRLMQFAARFGFTVEPTTERICKVMVDEGELAQRRNVPGVKESFENAEWPEKKKDPRETEEKRKGFLVVENGEVVHRRMADIGETKGLPPERVAEEMYKLLLKGKTPSLGFEFAMRIGLVERYWPELAALKGIPQEPDRHPEGDVWIHTMQTVDAMAMIANRELEKGTIPTKEMLQSIEKSLAMFFNARYRLFQTELYMKEIVAVLGEEELKTLQDEIKGRVGLFKKNFVEEKIKRAKEFRNESDIDSSKWEKEADNKGRGMEEAEITKAVRQKIIELEHIGKIDKSRRAQIETEAKAKADKATSEERGKRSIASKESAKIALLLAALFHDLGKATTTTQEDGVIHSYGHEQAGVEPARRILSTFDDTRFDKRIKRMILPLIAEHMRPKLAWSDLSGEDADRLKKMTEKQRKEIQKVDPKRSLKRLAAKLEFGDSEKAVGKSKKAPVYPDGGGADLYLLGLVAEADTEGRNPEGKPFNLSEMKENDEDFRWETWWNKMVNELRLDMEVEKILNGGDLMKALDSKGGPWVGVVLNCVKLDVRDGTVPNDSLQALEQALRYHKRLETYAKAKAQMEGVKEDLIWVRLTRIDPRQVLST